MVMNGYLTFIKFCIFACPLYFIGYDFKGI